MRDYPCPECGCEGPHIRIERELYECGDPECAAEFSIPEEVPNA